jgi:polyisoprenoid-binding protein YceI
MIDWVKRMMTLAVVIVLLSACGGGDAPSTSATSSEPATTTAPTVAQAPVAQSAAVSGLRTFVIVPEQSKATYLIDEEFLGGALAKLGIDAGKVDVVGATQAIEGQLQLNLDNLAAALGENNFTVQLNTLTTDQERRDKWIRENGPRFDQYPVASFQATAIEGAPSNYSDGAEVSFKLVGELNIREIAKPVAFDVTAKLTGDTLTGMASTRLKMSDFGIEPPNFANTLTVADEFGIEVQFTAKEK